MERRTVGQGWFFTEQKKNYSEIIKDLLPLYHDGVCSEDSKKAVEEHLLQCENCQAELSSMSTFVVPQKEQNIAEAHEIRQLSKRWKKGMVKSALKGVMFTILTIAAMLLFIYCFVGIHLG